jgi:hypothetical protein
MDLKATLATSLQNYQPLAPEDTTIHFLEVFVEYIPLDGQQDLL